MEMLLRAINFSEKEEQTERMDTTPTESFEWPSQNPVKWLDIMDALDPQELPEWPLLSPEIPDIICKQCSWKFYSVINLKRHEHLHLQSSSKALNNWMQSSLDRIVSLGEFWDTLSINDFEDIISLHDVELQGVPGNRIVLHASLKKPDDRLPPAYLEARIRLLDILQSKHPEIPISWSEFNIMLDNASEQTFLRSNMDDSYESYVFGNDVVKVDKPEREDLFACTCFLLEKKLIKAWLQYTLVKEEEDEMRRKAELKEKSRGKKQPKKKKASKGIDGRKGEERKLGDASGTLPISGKSRSNSSTCFKDSQSLVDRLPDASQICDSEKEEEDECMHKEKKSEEKIKNINLPDMKDPLDSLLSDETDYGGGTHEKLETQSNLLGTCQVPDAENGFKQVLKANEQESEEEKFQEMEYTFELRDCETSSGSALSKDHMETQVTQPLQSVSLADEGNLSDAKIRQEEIEQACKKTSAFCHAMPSSSVPPQKDLQALSPDAAGSPSKDLIQTKDTEPDESPSNSELTVISDSKRYAETENNHKESDNKELSFHAENIGEENEETSDISCSQKLHSSAAPSQNGSQRRPSVEAKLSAVNEIASHSSKKIPVPGVGSKKEIKQISKFKNTGVDVEDSLSKLQLGSFNRDDLQSRVLQPAQLTSSPIRQYDSRKDAEEHSKVKVSGEGQSYVQLSCGTEHTSAESHSGAYVSAKCANDGQAQWGVQRSGDEKHAEGNYLHDLCYPRKYANSQLQSGYTGKMPTSGNFRWVPRDGDRAYSRNPIRALPSGDEHFSGYQKRFYMRRRRKAFIPRHHRADMGQRVDTFTGAGTQACSLHGSLNSNIETSGLQDKSLTFKVHGNITFPIKGKHNLMLNARKSEDGETAPTIEQSQHFGQHGTGAATSNKISQSLAEENSDMNLDNGQFHISFSFEGRGGSENSTAPAPLAYDSDSITRAQDELARAWERMLKRKNIRQNQN